uniref:D-aminoacyl-tRNA deacylase n=1 Tax=Panagrellus redivivus TaxID=6233 RepID=A0A7E4ZW17_PANRE
MKAVIQRVKSASVTVDGQVVSEIGKGLCVLVGISADSTPKDAEFIIRKIMNLRLWDDPENGKKWDKSVKDLDYDVLTVSQFTLFGQLKGNKVDYHKAMEPVKAKEFYSQFLTDLTKAHPNGRIKDGIFGAMMDVNIVNDGPVTILLDSRDK